jgi:hypothetical protein
LTAAQQSVDLHRELAALNGHAYLPDLAMSVNSLAVRLAEDGRRADAPTAALEAHALYQESRRIHGDVYNDDAARTSRLVAELSDPGETRVTDHPRVSDR